MTKKEHIDYWLSSSISDWESVEILFAVSKYVQALFFTHLTLEKIYKSIYINFSDEIYPPKTHDLINLLSNVSNLHDEEMMIFLKAFNVYNLEGRYPDYLGNIYKTSTKEKTLNLINKAAEVRLCLLEMMQ